MPPKRYKFFDKPKIKKLEVDPFFSQDNRIDSYQVRVGENTPVGEVTVVRSSKNNKARPGGVFGDVVHVPNTVAFDPSPVSFSNRAFGRFTNKNVNELTENHINKTNSLWESKPRSTDPGRELSSSNPAKISELLKRQRFSAPAAHIRGVLKFIADTYPELGAVSTRRGERFRTRNVITPETRKYPFSGGKTEEYYGDPRPEGKRQINLDRIRKGNHPYEIED